MVAGRAGQGGGAEEAKAKGEGAVHAVLVLTAEDWLYGEAGRRLGQLRNFCTALLICLVTISPAFAGPPYATDDPEPTDYRSFEVYLYSEGTHTDGDTSGTLAGLEVNYGA